MAQTGSNPAVLQVMLGRSGPPPRRGTLLSRERGPTAPSQQRGRSPRDIGRVERGNAKGHMLSDSVYTTFSRGQ